MGRSRVEQCRALLSRCRVAWRAGHGDEAWALLEEAAGLQDAASSLPTEVLAVRAGLLLLAERFEEAARVADEAVDAATDTGGSDRHLLLAVADARVTLASTLLGGSGPVDERLTTALALLDRVAHDPALADTTPAARAVSNALNLRIETLGPRMHDTPGQVEVWTRVGEARALTSGWREQGTILRQAVDLAFWTGQWERGWDYAHQQLGTEEERNEQVAVLAKAAHLAWHRDLLPETRELGRRARSLSVAVDHPWVRTYAYLGGVLAAAAGAGSMEAALAAYTACTTTAGHATRPHRAGQAALVALEAGHPPREVRAFLARTLPGGLGSDHLPRWMGIMLADAAGDDLDPEHTEVPRHVFTAPERAEVCLALARWHRRHGRLTAASATLREAQLLLRDWPGRLLNQVADEIALTHPPVQATPAQRRVLDLLTEGMGNAEIARRLGLGERTVAVHVAALLRANGARSRTELAARHLRHQLTPV